MRPGWLPARKRTVFSLTQAVPSSSPTRPTWESTDRLRPAGEESLSRTGTVTTSPARTTAVSLVTTGGWGWDWVTGTMATFPVALEVPLVTVYSTVRLAGTVLAALICSREWSTTVTVTPESGGVLTDCRTRIPPEGSKSLVSGAMVVEPPLRSRAVSFSTSGGTVASALGVTSTRTMPWAVLAPSMTS